MTSTPSTPEEMYNEPKLSYTRSFIPANPQPIGSLLPADRFPQNANPPKLFQPMEIRGVTFKNRVIAVRPCRREGTEWPLTFSMPSRSRRCACVSYTPFPQTPHID